jgi:hypothetical protein
MEVALCITHYWHWALWLCMEQSRGLIPEPFPFLRVLPGDSAEGWKGQAKGEYILMFEQKSVQYSWDRRAD